MTDTTDDKITVRILWSTTGMCQPFASIAVATDMPDHERGDILRRIADLVTVGRKRQGDVVEAFIGRQCEDHVQVTCNAFHFTKVKGTAATPPSFVTWLRKRLPDADIVPAGYLEIVVVWLEPQTRAVHTQISR